jgi:flagellar hook-basal body complex protein FliE
MTPRIEGGLASTPGLAPAASEARTDFAETLRSVIAQVNELQQQADQKILNLLTGAGEDLHSTLIAVEKASLAFQMMVEARNKIVQAYREIAQMPF